MRLLDVWPVDAAAPASSSAGPRLDGRVEPVRDGHGGERQPDAGANRPADGCRAAAAEVIVAGNVAVDGQRHEGEHTDEADSVVNGVVDWIWKKLLYPGHGKTLRVEAKRHNESFRSLYTENTHYSVEGC